MKLSPKFLLIIYSVKFLYYIYVITSWFILLFNCGKVKKFSDSASSTEFTVKQINFIAFYLGLFLRMALVKALVKKPSAYACMQQLSNIKLNVVSN